MWFMMVAILINGQPTIEAKLPNSFVNEEACFEYGVALSERLDTKAAEAAHVEFGFKCVHYFEA